MFVEWCVFFFKQKTAYEMRISDWSSDVCSSDLPTLADKKLSIEARRPFQIVGDCRDGSDLRAAVEDIRKLADDPEFQTLLYKIKMLRKEMEVQEPFQEDRREAA